jgi:hypothetical protein
MPHLVLELALWILLAFFIGCIAGCLLRKALGKPPAELAAPRASSPEPAAAAKTARSKPPRKPPRGSK